MIPILFENQKVIIANKPAGSLSVPSRDRNDPRPIVGLELQKQINRTLFPVHRLDLEVSGILVFAKDADTHRRWQDLFQSRKVNKIYHALTTSPNPKVLPDKFQNLYRKADLEKPQTWECVLEKGKRRVFEASYGKKSITHAEFLKKIPAQEFLMRHGQGLISENLLANKTKNEVPPINQKSELSIADFLLWKLEPITGRSHQLRYELFRHGCPVLGDAVYGSPWQAKEKIWLSHVEFSLPNEVDGFQSIKIEML